MTEEVKPRSKVVLGAQTGHLVRFSYLTVFEPRMNKQSKALEFSVALLIPKNSPDVKAVRDEIDRLIAEQWTSKGKKLPPKFWNPLRDGDTDVNQKGDSLGPEAKGHYVLNAKAAADKAPQVVGTTRDQNMKLVPLTKGGVKSGDWGRASVNLSAYTKGDSGIGAYLNSIQLVKIGDPLGSSASADDDFGDFVDDENDPLA